VLGVGALTAAVALSGGTMLIAVPKVVAFGLALQTLSTAGIPGVSRAAGAGLKAATGFGKGRAATAGFLLGPWGIALGVGAAAIIGLNAAADSGAASQETLTNAISTSASAVKLLSLAGQRSDFSKLIAGDTTKSLQDLKTVIKELNGEPITIFSSFQAKEQSKALKDLGSALAQVGAADAPAAARSFKSLRDAQKLTTEQTSQLLDLMPAYKAELQNQATALGISASKSNLLKLATGEYQEAAKSAKAPTKDNADALQQLDHSAEDAAKAVEATSKALRDLTSPTLDARSAQRDFEAAVDAATQAVKDNGTSLDITTEKGRNNQSALDGIASSAEATAAALYTQTGSQDTATKAMEAGRNELIAALGQYGITGQAAQDYASKILGTPTDWATLFTNNAPQAAAPVQDLKVKMSNIPRGIQSQINVNIAGKGNIDATISAINSLDAAIARAARNAAATPIVAHATGPNRAFASGGRIVGPGTGTSDDVPIWASNNEWIIRERSATKYGPQIMHAINQGLLSKQQLMAAMSGAPRYATGGPVGAPVRYAPTSPVVNVTAPSGPSSVSLAGAQLSLSVDGRQMTAFVQEQVMAHDASQERSSRLGRQVRR
jgi:hypothetical protein